MNTINVSELITAGVGFTIEDDRTQRDFDDSGELRGVRYELSGDYVAYDGDLESEGIADINELRDSSDRWAHYGDNHVREMELMRALYLHLRTDIRDYREYTHLAAWRYRRFVALSRYAMRCNSPAKLKRMRKEMWRRYVQSVKACAVNGTWWALYLTKDQADSLWDYIQSRE